MNNAGPISRDPDEDVPIFSAALALPEADRSAYLAEACGADEGRRQRVEALLRSHAAAGDFMEETPVRSMRPADPAVGQKPGDRIGRYKLLQQIGEGGCGLVYMAEQGQPVRRRVALKIIKPGMDTKSVIARFEAERQALALMDHPSIAKVFDAGATELGRPYFVMELVRGVKITDYCDQNSLTTEDRLRLFIPVCQAVQHAHQKGIIHRDIKPSNILVTSNVGGAPLPVVIDFGIAKATDNQPLTDNTLFTAFEMLIGTPAYMSPEQAELTSVDVDTRTDIYSLGVLLYELLTGSTPFDTNQLLKIGVDEIRRVIREQEPLRPSTRLTRLAHQDLTAVAQRRNSDAPKLVRRIRGDLDWIAMKALEKNRTRRYETANGLALDIQRYLSNEPVSARAPNNLYRFQKTVLRNKLLFGCLAAGGLLTLLSLVVVSKALTRERQARLRAETEEVRSRQLSQFLKNMLNGVGPAVARGRDTVMLREILDQTAQRLGLELAGQPLLEEEMRRMIGRLYLEIGNYDRAEEMHRAALALSRRHFGTDSLQTASALDDLGLALWRKGRLPESEQAFHESIAIRRRALGPDHPDLAGSLNNLANVYRRWGRLSEAVPLAEQALSIRRRRLGNESLEVADSLRTLCILLGDQGRRAESEQLAREVLALRRRLLGAEHTLVASTLVDLAWAVTGTGKIDEAEEREREALAIRRKLLPENHPDVLKSLYLLGDRLRARGKLSESWSTLNAVLAAQRRLLGEENPSSLDTAHSLGLTLEAQGKLAEAEATYSQAVGLWRQRHEPECPQALAALESLGRVLVAQKAFDKAEAVLDDALTPEAVKQPASSNIRNMRAELRARRGAFALAAADAAAAVEWQPSNLRRCAVLAALLAKTSQLAPYEQLCVAMFVRFAKPGSAYEADVTAKTCLLMPVPSLDPGQIAPWADLAVTLGADDGYALPFYSVSKALAAYRLGRHREAAEWAEKAIASAQTQAQAQAYGVLSMARWRLGEKETARVMLKRGEALAPAVLPTREREDPGQAWLAWLYARILLEQAGQLMQGDGV